MRKALPFGASPAATWVGVKKNTRLLWKALSTSAAAMPSTASPPPIRAKRLCLWFHLQFFVEVGDFPRSSVRALLRRTLARIGSTTMSSTQAPKEPQT
jgi:hypothetical protein